MSWGAYGILIIFGAFILLLIFNPKLSCFGKRVKSPFYPLLRKKKKDLRAEDYGFRLGDNEGKRKPDEKKTPPKKTEDYGFRLD